MSCCFYELQKYEMTRPRLCVSRLNPLKYNFAYYVIYKTSVPATE